MLSRNTPVALVVGAAGFLGSFICEDLLGKQIQVVGVDSFKTGKKEHLEECVKSKDFHLINVSATDLDLELPRLDYIFIVAQGGWNIQKVLDLFKKYASKLVFVSHIDLYEKEFSKQLDWFQKTEGVVAKFAQENKLNARVVRMAAVFGPRMHFREDDPLVKTLLHTLQGKKISDVSQKDFCSRALYIDNAMKLIVKSVLSGSTALKIFDGAALTPVKIDEVKQLINSQTNFNGTPSLLPAWPTPNLEKTIKFLSWKPEFNLAQALATTLDYFKDHDFAKREEEVTISFEPKLESDEKEIKSSSQIKKHEVPNWVITREDIHDTPANRNLWSKLKITTVITLLLIGYAFVWPTIEIVWGGYLLRTSLTQTKQALDQGEFAQSLAEVQQAKEGLYKINQQLEDLEVLRKVMIFDNLLKEGDKFVFLTNLAISASEDVIKGTQNLSKGANAIIGQERGDSEQYFQEAQIEYGAADEKLSQAQALITKEGIGNYLPGLLKSEIKLVEERIQAYKKQVNQGRVVAEILPTITASKDKKSYLVLLQNNTELRPTGGFISSVAKVEFENGKLVKFNVSDINQLDEHLKIKVEPPAEIKEDLGQESWYLKDANWDPDFPTAAKKAEWFYTQETGERVEGVIAVDLILLEELLKYLGPMNVPGVNEPITTENLSSQVIANSKSILAAKKSFITELTTQALNKLIQNSEQNWSSLTTGIAQALEQKHLMFYFDNPKVFSLISEQNWTGELPKQLTLNFLTNQSTSSAKVQGVSSTNALANEDFLYVVEANLGANKANYYIERKVDLTTNINSVGEIQHQLKVTYTNRSPSSEWPAGKYKNRVRVYLPFGTKLQKIQIAENDITATARPFVDYGKTGYSFLVEIEPKTTNTLEINYQLEKPLSFNESNLTTYQLNVIKQAGTLNDPFNWQINLADNFHLSSPQVEELKPNQFQINSDLSKDKEFIMELYRR